MKTIRAFMELPRVNNQFDWKVMAIITSPSQNPAKWKDFLAYVKRESSEVTSHTFSPRVFVSIQILERGRMTGTDYNDRWFMMDPKGLYRFKLGLQKIYNGFQTKDLYYYDDGELRLNQEVSKTMMETIIAGDKTLRVVYATIKDDSNGSGDFEGIVIFVNNYNIFVTLTYFELGFMLSELEKLNLTQLGYELIRSAM